MALPWCCNKNKNNDQESKIKDWSREGDLILIWFIPFCILLQLYIILRSSLEVVANSPNHLKCACALCLHATSLNTPPLDLSSAPLALWLSGSLALWLDMHYWDGDRTCVHAYRNTIMTQMTQSHQGETRAGELSTIKQKHACSSMLCCIEKPGW